MVLGASRGLGLAVARELAQEGVDVALVARSAEPLQQSGFRHVVCDLMEPNQAPAILEQLGWPDIVVHNLGGSLRIADPLASEQDFARVWRLNLGVAVEFNRLIVPAMEKAGWGRIVHVSSVSAMNHTGYTPYVAAKAAVNAYVASVARALAPRNIVVSAVCPGPLFEQGRYLANLQTENGPPWKEYTSHHLPIGRLADPAEIAPFIALLCSERATFATGSIINVDGGSW